MESSDTTRASKKSADSTSFQGNVIKKSRQEVIKTIQEITKFDEFTINQAIEACQDSDGRYSMDTVLNILMDEKSSNEQSNRYNKQFGSSPSSSDDKMSKNLDGKRFDFALDNYSDELEEEYEAIMSLESSNSAVNRPEAHMLRDLSRPIGLKNIGNTCWFNSIIQSFFHLPYFRHLVLSFQYEESDLKTLDDNSKNVMKFVLELRKLFALMLRSKRRTLNPSQTLKCLRNCSKYDVDTFNQEDISEFATILVNLIEESFNLSFKQQQSESVHPDKGGDEDVLTNMIESSLALDDQKSKEATTTTTTTQSTNKNRNNPIVNLFNGDIKIMRKSSDDDKTNTVDEVFREVNIQMLNSIDLYSGLELEWSETSIDRQTAKTIEDESALNRSFYTQETWISKLPSVLFICLNRYKFIKATKSSSKIIEPFEFYQQIYLDRFLEANKEIVKAKRNELKNLNEQLKKLDEKLQSIKKYKYDGEKSETYPIDQVLRCVQHFARADLSSSDVFRAIKENEQQSSLLDQILQQWIERIEQKQTELKSQIDEVKHRIETIYDEATLRKHKYNLHSVCIHEGNATSGHFWTYIWNPAKAKWFKFNDVEVSETTWEDLYANAVGKGAQPQSTSTTDVGENIIQDNNNGDSIYSDATITATNQQQLSQSDTSTSNQRVPSAYFLIYCKSEDPTLYKENNELNQDLNTVLADDQQLLENQLNKLKLKLLLKESNDNMKKSNQQLLELNEKFNLNLEQNSQTCLEHAKAFSDSTLHALTSSYDILTPSNSSVGDQKTNDQSDNVSITEKALENAINIEMKKYSEGGREVAQKLPDHDLRIDHILIYFNCNNASEELKRLALYDLFRMQVYSDSNVKLKALQNHAQHKYNLALIDSITNATGVQKAYEKMHADYRDYRSIIAAFINASRYLESQRYDEALPFYCVACEYNERLTGMLEARMRGMDHEYLLANRRKCIKLWSQSVIKRLFKRVAPKVNPASPAANSPAKSIIVFNEEEMSSQIDILVNKFLPCFYRLTNSTADDRRLIDEIRQDWLGILDNNPPELPQAYHLFLTKLLEDPVNNHYHSLNVNKTDLSTRYKETFQLVQKIRLV